MKNTFRRYYGWHRPHFGEQDGRVVKAPSLIAENVLNIRRICVGSKSCFLKKKSIGWAVGAKVTSRRYYGRRKPIFLEGRMAEWLRPRVFIAENGLNILRISVGSKSCPSRKSVGWAVGAKVTSRRYYGRHKPIYFEDRMAEWLRP